MPAQELVEFAPREAAATEPPPPVSRWKILSGEDDAAHPASLPLARKQAQLRQAFGEPSKAHAQSLPLQNQRVESRKRSSLGRRVAGGGARDQPPAGCALIRLSPLHSSRLQVRSVPQQGPRVGRPLPQRLQQAPADARVGPGVAFAPDARRKADPTRQPPSPEPRRRTKVVALLQRESCYRVSNGVAARRRWRPTTQ